MSVEFSFSINQDFFTGYFSIADLRERGWTERLVKIFLGEADKSVSNPRHKTGRPMRMYRAERVILVEKIKKEFIEEKSRSSQYSARLKQATTHKRQNLETIVNELQLPIFNLTFSELLYRANEIIALDCLCRQQDEGQVAVEILLDSMGELDAHLELYAWHPGIRDARKLLKRRMLDLIQAHYPALRTAVMIRAAEE